jgi:hypothetical protein
MHFRHAKALEGGSSIARRVELTERLVHHPGTGRNLMLGFTVAHGPDNGVCL